MTFILCQKVSREGPKVIDWVGLEGELKIRQFHGQGHVPQARVLQTPSHLHLKPVTL